MVPAGEIERIVLETAGFSGSVEGRQQASANYAGGGRESSKNYALWHSVRCSLKAERTLLQYISGPLI